MRNLFFLSIGVFLLAVLVSGTGCQSTSRKSGGWLTSTSKAKRDAVLETAPEFRGQTAIANEFSSQDVYPVAQLPSGPAATGANAPTAGTFPAAFNVVADPPNATPEPPFPFGGTVPATPESDPYATASASSTPPPFSPSPASPIPAFGDNMPTEPISTVPDAPFSGVSAFAPPSNPAQQPTTQYPPAPTGNLSATSAIPPQTPSYPASSHPPLSNLPELPEMDAPDPWGFGFPDSNIRNAVSIEEAAKDEEDARERARLTEVATAKREDGTPDYLQPLDNRVGPFASREKKETLEQDLIRQAGYQDVASRPYDNTPVFDWELEEEKGFDWSVLDPVNFFTKLRDWVGLGPDETKSTAAMKKGREILLSNPDLKDPKKCQEAAKCFNEAAWRWPDSVMEEDALHLAGESYYFAGDYDRALKSYQKLMIKYQHSKHLDNAGRRLFAIGRYWEQEDRRGVPYFNVREKTRPLYDTFGFAHKAYETIFINDPNSSISDDAVMALATAYLAKGKYQGDTNFDKAAYYYSYLRENYPLSKHIAKAHEYELHARTQAYLGPSNDGKTLDEAGKLAEATLRQFSSELESRDKDEVLNLKEGIIVRQAEREWTLGQYYEKKQYYGSAELFYNKILDKYPQTPFAEKAQERLEAIKDKPRQPDQFEFLKRLYKPRQSF